MSNAINKVRKYLKRHPNVESFTLSRRFLKKLIKELSPSERVLPDECWDRPEPPTARAFRGGKETDESKAAVKQFKKAVANNPKFLYNSFIKSRKEISMTRQKFIVGELVQVCSTEAPEWNTPCVEVTLADYITTRSLATGEVTTGWRYRTAHMPEIAGELRFREESLVKLPRQGDSFEEMMNKLKLGVPA